MQMNSIYPVIQKNMDLPLNDHKREQPGGVGAGATAPSFLRNTHDMISFCDRNNSRIASWGKNGTQMVIYDQEALTRDVFPGYFKHTNFKSFARQLNFYGFRKIKSKDKNCCIYHHDFFMANHPELLPQIQRHANENHLDTLPLMTASQKNTSNISSTSEVCDLKEKVSTLTSTVLSLNQELSDLKVLVASLADVIQGHDALLRSQQQNISHYSNVVTVGMIENSLNDPRNYDRNEAHNEALKPQAKQPPSPSFALQIKQAPASVYQPQSKHPPSHNYSAIIKEGQSVDTYNYGAMLSIDNTVDEGLSSAKRQRMSDVEPYKYSPVDVVGHSFTSTAATTNIIQENAIHQEYERHINPWTIHTSEHTKESHHHVNNNNNSINNNGTNQHTGIDNYMQDSKGNNDHDNGNNKKNVQEETLTASIFHEMECSADYDFGYEDVAWFTLFEEDVSHRPDDPTTAPQA